MTDLPPRSIADRTKAHQAAVAGGLCNAKMLGLLPEFLEYLEAVLPGSAPVLKPVFEVDLSAGGEEGGLGYSS